MKQKKRISLRSICLLAGIGFLAAGAVVLAAWQWGIRSSAQKAETYVNTLRTLMPEPQNAVHEVWNNASMPVLSIEGTDFLGILDLPSHGSSLPVCAHWGKSSRYPCRFSGSIYDGTMQIGGTSQKGQYDFYREISAGDPVFFTDITGNRYTYTVTDIRYRKHADQDALQSTDAALKLFIKNVYGFDYVIIFCDVPE